MSDSPRWQILIQELSTHQVQEAVPCQTPEDVHFSFAERIKDTQFWGHDRIITVVQDTDGNWLKMAEWNSNSDEINIWEVQDLELPLGQAIRQVALETELDLDIAYVSGAPIGEAEAEAEVEAEAEKTQTPVPSFFRDYFEIEQPMLQSTDMGTGRTITEETTHEVFVRYLRQRRKSSIDGNQVD